MEENKKKDSFGLRLNGCYSMIHGSYWMLYGVLLLLGTVVTTTGALIITFTIGRAWREGRDVKWNGSTEY